MLNWSYGAEHQRYKACANTCGGLDASTLYLYDPATGGMSERYAPVLHPVTWRDYIVADGRIVAVRMLTGSTLVWSYVVGDHLKLPHQHRRYGHPAQCRARSCSLSSGARNARPGERLPASGAILMCRRSWNAKLADAVCQRMAPFLDK